MVLNFISIINSIKSNILVYLCFLKNINRDEIFYPSLFTYFFLPYLFTTPFE